MTQPKTINQKSKNTVNGASVNISADSTPPLAVQKPKYPMSHIMKKNRIIKLQQTKCKCEICKKRAQLIHHLDGSLDNHSVDNLLTVCAKCHKAIHHPDKVDGIFKTSKYIRLYGATMAQLAKRTGFPPGKIYEMHYKNELKSYLKELITTAEQCLAKRDNLN